MTRLLDEAAGLACLAYVDLNPLRAHLTDSLEAYPHISIGERLRTLENEGVNSSNWLAPIAVNGETNGQPVTVVNQLSREELAKRRNALTPGTQTPGTHPGKIPPASHSPIHLPRTPATKRHAGRDFRLTDVAGVVAGEILA